jgi:diguanylate cyclase (GGDEF)-like protein
MDKNLSHDVLTSQFKSMINTPAQESFESLTRLVKRMFDVPFVFLSFFDDKRHLLQSIIGLDVVEMTKDVSLFNLDEIEDDIIVIEDTTKDDKYKNHSLVTSEPNIRFYVCCPIYEKNLKKVGALFLLGYEAKEFSEIDLNQLKDVVKAIETEINNNQLTYAQKKLVYDLSQCKDNEYVCPLTKVWQYEAFAKVLKYQVEESNKTGEIFGLSCIDIDNLTLLNQQYGFDGGNEVLKDVAKSLIRSCRSEDSIGRGQEEDFIVLIHTPDKKNINTVANRIQSTIVGDVVTYANKSIHVNATVGLAFFEPEKDTVETLLLKLQLALLKGKRAGRNCTYVQEDLTLKIQE